MTTAKARARFAAAAARHAVLMIHGAGGSGWEWNVWRRVFEAGGHATTAIELRPATAGLAATRFAHYLDQATSVALTLPAPRVLIGASLGGLLALAVSEAVECAALVLVNPLPPTPEAHSLPARAPYPPVVPWGRDASLAGTRRALPDADDAACLYAFRRWRDESGAVLNAARHGMAVAAPRCPVRVVASDADDDVPTTVSVTLAQRLGASLDVEAGSHVGPLLGRSAAGHAAAAVRWLNAAGGFTTD